MSFDDLLRHNLQGMGQRSFSSGGDTNLRNVYPARVEFVEDPLQQGRIKARIDGKDKDIPNIADLPWSVPLKSGFLYTKPRVGEMVFIFLENPSESTGIRYWSGPVHTSQYNHQIETFNVAKSIYRNSNTGNQPVIPTSDLVNLDIPKNFDVGLEGREDAWLILKPREVRLVAGAFEKGSLKPNTQTPSSISISQQENDPNDNVNLQSYSKSEITSTVINLYSHLGKFRDENIARFEINDNLDSFDELTNSLSPSVKGDELVKLLDLIVQFLLNHIHTPQSPAATTQLSQELSRYTVDGELQRLLSSYVRIN